MRKVWRIKKECSFGNISLIMRKKESFEEDGGEGGRP